jgi:hypothetical protein
MAHAGWSTVPRQAGWPADGPAGAHAARLLGQAIALWLWPGRSALRIRRQAGCSHAASLAWATVATRGSTLAAAVTVVAFREANRG